MAQLIAFSEERPARLLANYLNSRGIRVAYARIDGEFEHSIDLLDPHSISEARQIAQHFLDNPNDKKYQQAAWQQEEQVDISGPRLFDATAIRAQLTGIPFTLFIGVSCLLIYILSVMGWSHQIYSALHIQPLALLAESHQWWRLLGPVLLHFSVVHIVFNVLWWWSLGGQIERKFGISFLVVLFTVASLSSNVAQLLVSGPNFGGLSGVVYAVVGFVWWCGWLKPEWGLMIPKPVVGFLLVWLLLGYADLLWVNMANTAHTVGLITGCISAWLYIQMAKKAR